MPIVRLCTFCATVSIGTSVIVVLVVSYAQNVAAAFAAGLLSTIAGIVLVSRWWIRASRALGVAAPMPAIAQWQIGLAVLFSIAAAVALTLGAYVYSHSRVTEACVAVVSAVPIGLFIIPASFERMRPVTAIETSAWRSTYYSQLLVGIVSAGNLALMLVDVRQHTAQSRATDTLRTLNIAASFVLLTLVPFSLPFARRRYLEAKRLEAIAPPDRWQAYNERLAREE